MAEPLKSLATVSDPVALFKVCIAVLGRSRVPGGGPGRQHAARLPVGLKRVHELMFPAR